MKRTLCFIILTSLVLFLIAGIFSAQAVNFDSVQEYYKKTAARSGWDITKEMTPADYAAKIILVMLTIVGPLFLILIIYSGVVWMTSGGEVDKITKAKKTIIYAIIGLIIIFSAYSIAYFVSTGGGRLQGTGNYCDGSCTTADACRINNGDVIVAGAEACAGAGAGYICCSK